MTQGLFDGATWKGPVPNMVVGGMGKIQGIVLHIMQGTLAGCDSWFHNPSSQVSAHFGNGKTGLLYQWVNADNVAWAEAGGNPYWLSIEHEGVTGQSLTPEQILNDAKILVWAHENYGVPFTLANDPSQSGLGYHAMGGVPWGNHPDCPGPPIIAQRTQIIEQALTLTRKDINNMQFMAKSPDGPATCMFDVGTKTYWGLGSAEQVLFYESLGIKNVTGVVPAVVYAQYTRTG